MGYPRDRGRAQGGGRAPQPRGQGVGPLALILLSVFFRLFKTYRRGFSSHSDNCCFLHNKQHHGSSAENSVSPG